MRTRRTYTRHTQRAARPWKYAALISIICTIIAAAGILVGYLRGQLLWGLVLMLPLVGYEAYRTAGDTTRWASWAMLILLIASIILVWFNINLDLGKILGTTTTMVAGQTVPLGDVKMVMPALMGVCALILLIRTRGRYTKFMALVIFIASVVLVYQINPSAVSSLIRQGLNRLR
ncbi:MAG: hypothetical protein ACYC6L_11345 [Anaerolineae bacterium]